MPIYEYSCESCGRVTEALQRFADPPLAACPHCGGTLKKLLSAPAFQFKGQGWYVTDYARKGGAAPAGRAESASSGGAESASSGGPEAAPKPASGETPAAAPKADPAPGSKPVPGE